MGAIVKLTDSKLWFGFFKEHSNHPNYLIVILTV